MFNNKHIKSFILYLLIVFFPIIFGLLSYFCILDIDKKTEINVIKSNISRRATDFMAKTTAVDYFQPYFHKLANKLTPYIDNYPDENGVMLSKSDVSKAINELSETLGEIIRCAVFRKRNLLLNPQDLQDYEQRFFIYFFNIILVWF